MKSLLETRHWKIRDSVELKNVIEH